MAAATSDTAGDHPTAAFCSICNARIDVAEWYLESTGDLHAGGSPIVFLVITCKAIVISRISHIRVLVCYSVLLQCFVTWFFFTWFCARNIFMLVDNEGVSNSHKRLSSQGMNSNFELFALQPWICTLNTGKV